MSIFTEKTTDMNDGLRLKIGKQWAVLPDEISISVEMTSPLWNDSGTFSYSFRLPYTANSAIFHMASLPETDSRLNNFREDFELYINGVCLLYGDIVCSSEEIDQESDSLDVELRSDLSVFSDAIKDADVRDLDFDFKIGTWNQIWEFVINVFGHGEWQQYERCGQDIYTPMSEISGLPGVSVSYPKQPFINLPLLVNSERTFVYQKGCRDENTTKEKRPLLLSPFRSMSSPCFYLLYIYDRILQYSGFRIIGTDYLKEVDDMYRIIILNTKFATRYGEYIYEKLEGTDKRNKRCDMYLTSENLPDISMAEFMEVLKNTFGHRLIPGRPYELRSVLIRDVLKSNETLELHIDKLVSVNRKHIPFTGITLKYSQDEGNEYDYNTYTNTSVYDNYHAIVERYHELSNTVNAYGESAADSDTTLYISKDTGNYYRVKVDKEANTEGSLFEVGQFNPYRVEADRGSLDEEPEEMVLNFQPLIPTPVSDKFFHPYYDQNKLASMPKETYFVNVEVQWETSSNAGGDEYHMDNYNPLNWMVSCSYNPGRAKELLENICDFDMPFTLGVLRNSDKGIQSNQMEIIRPDADGFGNDQWVSTASYDSITSDSLTHYGEVYDYNGKDEGIGIDPKDLISLKLWNCKQNFNPSCLNYTDEEGVKHPGEEVYNNHPSGALPNRGLVPQFLAEYLYFMKHRRTIVIEAYMEVSELVNLQWDKYYRIAGYRCMLNKASFEVNQDGLGLVTIEAFMI